MTDSKKIEHGGPDLSALIEKLEKAEGPDRGIDRDIADALGFGPDDSWERPNHKPGIYCMDVGDWMKGGRIRSSARYTSSVDVAVNIADRLNLEARWELTTTGYKPGASLVTSAGIFGAYAANLPMAICLATLRALQRKGEA